MEPQKPHQFTTVTNFSKILAALLFIVLPFVGLYIGYTFAPEKVVEVPVASVAEVKEVPEEATLDEIAEAVVATTEVESPKQVGENNTPTSQAMETQSVTEEVPVAKEVEEINEVAEPLSEERSGKLQYFYAAEHFEYVAAPECGPFDYDERGPFSVDAGDGSVYVADCKGVVDHSYAAPGYYVATYLEDGVVIARLEVLVE